MAAGHRRSVAVRLTLRAPATMAGQSNANKDTMGNVQMDFKVPRELDFDMTPAMTLGFSTMDPGNALSCVIYKTGDDLFTAFKLGTDLKGGPEDIPAVVDYLGAHPGVTAPASRIGGL